MDDDGGELCECPVCGLFLPCAEIEAHAGGHFGASQPAAASAAEQQQARAREPPDDCVLLDDDGDAVACPYGCGALVALADLDSHEEAHRSAAAAARRSAAPAARTHAQRPAFDRRRRRRRRRRPRRLQEMEAQHASAAQAALQQEHEELQKQFGFSDKRPGKCCACGEEGHWAVECPRSTAVAAVRGRAPLSTEPEQLAVAQAPDPHPEVHGVDVVPLLAACFAAQPKAHSTVLLSGSVGFHSGSGAPDIGWGCGFRNIQMQARRPGAARRGCGWAPPAAPAWRAAADPARRCCPGVPPAHGGRRGVPRGAVRRLRLRARRRCGRDARAARAVR
ncbi:hypothetical protein HT031_004078 [Scenedesmus sp. PABB004]|nr:hypothetical protein HT031_004078 [Scenedesmus sp. PABB004]